MANTSAVDSSVCVCSSKIYNIMYGFEFETNATDLLTVSGEICDDEKFINCLLFCRRQTAKKFNNLENVAAICIHFNVIC